MKKIIYAICAVAFVATAVLNVNLTLQGEKMTKLQLTNVVALAQDEEYEIIWMSYEQNCTSIFYGTPGGEAILSNGDRVTFDQSGRVYYVVEGEDINCSVGGYRNCNYHECETVTVYWWL